MDPIDERLRRAGASWRRDHAASFMGNQGPVPVRVRGTMRTGLAVPGVAIAAVAVLLAAVAIAPRLVRQTIQTSDTGSGATNAPDATQGSSVASVRVALPGEVYSIAFDGARNRLWLAAFNIGGPDHLLAVDAALGKVVEDVALPDVENNGFTSVIKIGADGSVWVTEPYALVKYDVAAGQISSATLAPDPAAPTSDGPGSLAGSWASSFAFQQGRVVLGRNGVSYLTVFDGNLAELQRVTVPSAVAGPAQMASDGRSLYLTGSYASASDDIWLVDSKWQASVTPFKGRRLADAFNRVVASGGAVPALDIAAGAAALPGTGGSANDLATADGSGGVVAYDAAANQLVRARNGSVLASFPLGTQPVTVTNPLGQEIKTFTKPRVAAIAADADGKVWYVDATAKVLIKVGL